MLRTSAPATLLLLLPLLLVALPATVDAGDAKVAKARLKVANAWIDPALPGPAEYPSAYFVIQNREDRLRTIVGGSSPDCDSVEIHRTVFRDGAMGSEVMAEMQIPARGAVAFVPRGLALALIGARPLAPGDKVSIELELGDGEKLPIEAVVRDE